MIPDDLKIYLNEAYQYYLEHKDIKTVENLLLPKWYLGQYLSIRQKIKYDGE